MEDNKLFTEFPPISTEKWEEVINKDLKAAEAAVAADVEVAAAVTGEAELKGKTSEKPVKSITEELSMTERSLIPPMTAENRWNSSAAAA